MKKAIQYVSGLSFESLDEAGLAKISAEMDNFSEKEKFEVLLVIFARFLGTIDFEEPKADATIHGGIHQQPVPATNPQVEPQSAPTGHSESLPGKSEPSDDDLQRALSNLPPETEHTEADKAVIRMYRSRFGKR